MHLSLEIMILLRVSPQMVSVYLCLCHVFHSDLLCILDVAIVNHPVHIVTKDNQISPSSLIPFCEFGGNMSAMGVKINEFDVPVCNSFKATIFNDQLCYEVDLQKFSSNHKIELKSGFAFIMDYNEDRQVVFDKGITETDKEFGLVSSIVESDQDQHAFIYLNSVGISYHYIHKPENTKYKFIHKIFIRARCVDWRG